MSCVKGPPSFSMFNDGRIATPSSNCFGPLLAHGRHGHLFSLPIVPRDLEMPIQTRHFFPTDRVIGSEVGISHTRDPPDAPFVSQRFPGLGLWIIAEVKRSDLLQLLLCWGAASSGFDPPYLQALRERCHSSCGGGISCRVALP